MKNKAKVVKITRKKGMPDKVQVAGGEQLQELPIEQKEKKLKLKPIRISPKFQKLLR